MPGGACRRPVGLSIRRVSMASAMSGSSIDAWPSMLAAQASLIAGCNPWTDIAPVSGSASRRSCPRQGRQAAVRRKCCATGGLRFNGHRSVPKPGRRGITLFVLCSDLPVVSPVRCKPIDSYSDLTRLGGGCGKRGCLPASGRDFLSERRFRHLNRMEAKAIRTKATMCSSVGSPTSARPMAVSKPGEGALSYRANTVWDEGIDRRAVRPLISFEHRPRSTCGKPLQDRVVHPFRWGLVLGSDSEPIYSRQHDVLPKAVEPFRFLARGLQASTG